MNRDREIDVLSQVDKDIAKVKDAVLNGIRLTTPIVMVEEERLIYPNSITVIQGKTGVHKSRLATIISSLLISNNLSNEYLGLKRNDAKKYGVVYFDTERSITELFPSAIQQLIKNAEIDPSTYDTVLKHVPLINVSRDERTEVIKLKLKDLQLSNDRYWVVVLDVVTDCVSDFNSSEASLKLIDSINELVNNFNMTFLCVIHENPGSEKARGHLGTEILNKASSCIQISKYNKLEDVYVIENTKNRGGRNVRNIHCEFSEAEGTLIILAKERLKQLRNDKKKEDEAFRKLCYDFLKDKPDGSPASIFKEFLGTHLKCSASKITSKVNEVINKIIHIENGANYYLKNTGNTKSSMFKIEVSQE